MKSPLSDLLLARATDIGAPRIPLYELEPVRIARLVARGELHPTNANKLVSPQWMTQFQQRVQIHHKAMKKEPERKRDSFLKRITVANDLEAEAKAAKDSLPDPLTADVSQFRNYLEFLKLANQEIEGNSVLNMSPLEVATFAATGEISERNARRLVTPEWLDVTIPFYEREIREAFEQFDKHPQSMPFVGKKPPVLSIKPYNENTHSLRKHLLDLKEATKLSPLQPIAAVKDLASLTIGLGHQKHLEEIARQDEQRLALLSSNDLLKTEFDRLSKTHTAQGRDMSLDHHKRELFNALYRNPLLRGSYSSVMDIAKYDKAMEMIIAGTNRIIEPGQLIGRYSKGREEGANHRTAYAQVVKHVADNYRLDKVVGREYMEYVSDDRDYAAVIDENNLQFREQLTNILEMDKYVRQPDLISRMFSSLSTRLSNADKLSMQGKLPPADAQMDKQVTHTISDVTLSQRNQKHNSIHMLNKRAENKVIKLNASRVLRRRKDQQPTQTRTQQQRR